MVEHIERIPPQDKEAEQAVLGSVFLLQDAYFAATKFITAEDFYLHQHKVIFEAMSQLINRNIPVDIRTITDELSKQHQLENAGGISYLSDIAVIVPSPANAGHYAKIVAEKAARRRLIAASTETVQKAFDTNEDVIDLITITEQALMAISQDTDQKDFQAIAEILGESMFQIEENAKNHDVVTGLATGFPELDKMTAGFQSDQLIILAARPGMGKTAFALNIAQNVGTKTDKRIAIFSLEMSAVDLVNRMLCAEGLIDSGHLRTGQLNEEEWEKLVMAMGQLSNTQIFIDDTPGIKVPSIRAKCHKLTKEKGQLGLVVIDYLQLIEGSVRESRQQQVSEISRELKKLAKELNCPVIALSQLSRGVEARENKRPILSDLRESGSIEQDADIVMFLYRDDYYRQGGDERNEDDAYLDEDTATMEVDLQKNRTGKRGMAKIIFKKNYNKFLPIAYREDNPVPF
ncbi:MAG: replicative DNA helicase [Lactobacillales bacterium]|jgi:replicative DNA helicase|nr:replicative DNA helicase [Lactobacillales bacterium]